MARLDQAQAIDNLVAVFEEEVQRIVAEARRETLRFLQDRLATTDGVIDRTQANARTLARVEDAFRTAMRRAGYDELVNEFVDAFNGQFEYFHDVVARLAEESGRNFRVTFGDRDKSLFLQQQGQAKDLLQQAVDIQAKAAQQQALFSVGAMKASQLGVLISEKLDMTAPRAAALADTSLSTFYRTIADRGFQQVEKAATKKIKLRYRYGGPNDKLTRQFCLHALAGTAYGSGRVKVLASKAEDHTYTREEIAQMSNGMLPNVMLTCGGYRCRHQWLLVAEVQPNARGQRKQAKGAK